MGGYHPTLCPDEVLQYADAIVIGDSDDIWKEILDDVDRGQLQRIYKAPARSSLEGLRFDRRIFAGKKYNPISLAQVARGCRFACDFCSIHAFYGAGVTARPTDEVVAELATLPKHKPVFLVDDNLFGRRDDFIELMAAIAPLGLRWTCQISIDVARDDELINLMAKAGCMLVLIGFESLNRQNLIQMRKKWNGVSGDYDDVVRRFHDLGIMIYGTFVIGYDADDRDTWKHTLEFAQQSRLSIANFNPLTPMPGTALYNRVRSEHRMLIDEWWLNPDYRYGQTIFRPHGMTPDELAEGCFNAREQFYRYGSILKRTSNGPRLWTDPYKLGVMLLANWISRQEVHRKQDAQFGQIALTPELEAAA